MAQPTAQRLPLDPRLLLLAMGGLVWLNSCALLAGMGNSPVEYFESEVQQELIRAVMRQDASRMDRALAQGADINKIGEVGNTPLLVAIRRNRLQTVQLLLERGADPSLVSPMPEEAAQDIDTPVQAALRKRSTEYLRVLLEHGADPDSPVAYEQHNITALYFAVRKREHPEYTRLLVEHGADLNHRALYGDTPLMEALFSSCFVNALILLEGGADPLVPHSRGHTAITIVRSKHPRWSRQAREGAYDKGGYFEFIEALKERGYLEEDFE